VATPAAGDGGALCSEGDASTATDADDSDAATAPAARSSSSARASRAARPSRVWACGRSTEGGMGGWEDKQSV
jgi:hypothetical protein